MAFFQNHILCTWLYILIHILISMLWDFKIYIWSPSASPIENLAKDQISYIFGVSTELHGMLSWPVYRLCVQITSRRHIQFTIDQSFWWSIGNWKMTSKIVFVRQMSSISSNFLIWKSTKWLVKMDFVSVKSHN